MRNRRRLRQELTANDPQMNTLKLLVPGRRSALSRVILAGLVVAGSLSIDAAPVEAADKLVIDAGYGGFAQPGRPFPATIQVTVDALFTGELRLTSQNGSILNTTQRLEVAGGTTRELTVIIESAPWDLPSVRADLVADDTNEVVATATARLRVPGDGELVGVFPSLSAGGLPETSSLTIDAGEANLFAIEPDRFELGYGVLAPLDIIAVTAADLRDLDDATYETLMVWINLGGRLLVDEAPGSTVRGLPADWQPDGATPHPAGLGEIIMTGGAAARGEWDEILEPAPTRSLQEDQAFAENGGFYGAEPLSWSLGRDAGFNLPGAMSMLVMLGAYVVIVGPITWFVLRAIRRPGLAWVVIPAVSVLFTGLLWMLGSSVREGVDAAHGTILEVAPRGSVASTYELVSSRSGGGVSLRLPAGWSPRSSFNEPTGGSLTLGTFDDGDVEVAARLDAGAFAVLGGTGSLPEVDGAIEVFSASSEPGEVTGTVINHLEVALSDVVVFADQAGTKIGDVAAGATVEFVVNTSPVDPTRGEPIEMQVWRNALPPGWTGDFGRPFDPGAINLSLWGEWNGRGSLNSRAVGLVVVAGWTDQLASPIDPDVKVGRTLVVARAPIEATDDTVTDVAASRRIVRGPDTVGNEFRNFEIWGGGAMVAFTVPDSAERDDLVLSLPRAQQRADLLVDGEWRQISVPIQNSGVFALPDGAIDARGRVYVKVLISMEQGIKWRDLSVRTITARDKTTPLEFVVAEG